MKLQTGRKSALSVVVLTMLGIAAVVGGFLLSKIGTAPDDSSAAAGDTFTVCPDNSTAGCDFLFGEGIQQAISAAQTDDIVLIRAGTYTLPQPQVFRASDGQQYNCFAYVQNKNLTIKGENGNVILDGSTLLEGSNGICIDSATVTVANLEIKNFKLNGSRTLISEGNGIQVLSGSLLGQGLKVNNNDGSGISLDESFNSALQNSILNGNKLDGVDASDTANLRLTNNTIINSGLHGIYLIGATSSSTVNNLVHNNGKQTAGDTPSGIIAEQGASFTQLTANLSSFNNGGNYTTQLPINNFDQTSHICRPIPGFKNTGSTQAPYTTGDFHLIDNGSGACDKAFAIDQGIASILDPDGSISDIGAYGGTAACSLDPALPGCSGTCSCLQGVVVSDSCVAPEAGVCIDDGTCTCSSNVTPTPTSPATTIITCEQGFSDNFASGLGKWDVQIDTGTTLDIQNEELVFVVEDLMPRIYRHVEVETKQTITGEFAQKVSVMTITPDSSESGSAMLTFFLDNGSIVEEEFKIAAGYDVTGSLTIEGSITDDYSITLPSTDPPVSGSIVDLYVERVIRPGMLNNVDVYLYYDLGQGKQLLGKESLPPLFATDGKLRLRGENTGPDFLAFRTTLDNVAMTCPVTAPTTTPTATPIISGTGSCGCSAGSVTSNNCNISYVPVCIDNETCACQPSSPPVTPTVTTTVVPTITGTVTPPISPTITSTPAVTASPTPIISSQIYYCGQMDVGGANGTGDGIFNIVDLAAFAQGYPNRTCLVQTVGPTVVQPKCGFVDSTRDGKVNIADFASFAQRYYYPGNRPCDL